MILTNAIIERSSIGKLECLIHLKPGFVAEWASNFRKSITTSNEYTGQFQ